MNNQQWNSPELEMELQKVTDFYKQTVDVTFSVLFTKYDLVWEKFKVNDQTSPLFGQITARLEETAYDRTFTKTALAFGQKNNKRIDVVCAVVPVAEWKGITGGLCSDDSQGIQQLAIRGQAGVNYLNGDCVGQSELAIHLNHELSHAFYRYLGLRDRTHAVCIGDEQYMPYWSPSDMRLTTAYSLKRSAWVKLRDYWRKFWGMPTAN
jgi:hypothetical protein